jgi:hypothetical protein
VTEPLRAARAGEQSATLLEVALKRAGVMKGARATEFVIAWGTAVSKLGHELGAAEGGHLSAAMREYASYWKVHERTAWRELHRFREVFPEEESPARLVVLLRELQQARRDERAALSELRIAV